ncbi:protein YbjX [Raoultella ornithinolytica]|nr:protein YbjX [Raoultella ornithinolytica]
MLTKELHGTRPKNLIISLLYGFLQHSDIKEIYAIDSDFHVKSEKVQTSYAALWLEVGGEKHRRGWYKLPPQEIKKSIEEVKSKHRSQFIKREGLKELAQLEMKAALRQISGSRPVN